MNPDLERSRDDIRRLLGMVRVVVATAWRAK